MEGIHVERPGQEVWGTEVLQSQGKAPVGGLRDQVPQKLQQNVKLAYKL